MQYDINDLQVLDVIAWMRNHPERFFDGQITGNALVTALVKQIHKLGGRDVRFFNHDEWHAVVAECDWLQAGRFTANEVETFGRMLAFPEGGQNSIRAEVLIGAFASDVVTITKDGECRVTGSASLPECLNESLRTKNWARAVAFRMAQVPA